MMANKPLPESFDFKSLVHPTVSQQARLASLPRKILRTIFNQIDHPRDQIAFMLTCKRIARRTSREALKQGSVIVNRPDGTQRIAVYKHLHLLMDLRRWKLIDQNLQLCKSCAKYLPLDRVWRTKDKQLIRDLPRVDWMWAVAQWKRGVSPCPTCQVEGGVSDEQWLQTWPEGFARGTLVKQSMIAKEIK